VALVENARHYQIKLIEFMVLSYQNKFKKQFRTLLMADEPKYESMIGKKEEEK